MATQLRRSLSGSLDAMHDVGVGLLVVAVAVLPWLVPLGLIVLLVVWLLKKNRITK